MALVQVGDESQRRPDQGGDSCGGQVSGWETAWMGLGEGGMREEKL